MKNLRLHIALWCVMVVLFFGVRAAVHRRHCRARSRELFQLMAKSGCPPACAAARELLAKGVDFSVRDQAGETLLMRAVLNTDTSMVEMIERAGAPQDDTTALFVATFLERPPAVERLLKQGISPNIRDGEGHTPLFYAALLGDVPIVKLLLHYGADKNAIDKYGETALDSTQAYAEEGNRIAARLLKSLGAKHGEELKIRSAR